jgi:DNA-directed RNA polymerase specialized sigma24 family protein
MKRGREMDHHEADFEAFFRVYWKRVLVYVESRIGNNRSADVASEALITAWEKWDERPRESQENQFFWVLGIAKNRIRHEWRSSEVRQRRIRELRAAALTELNECYSAERVALSSIGIVDGFRSLSSNDQSTLLRKSDRIRQRPLTRPPGRQEPQSSRMAMQRLRARKRLMSAIG